MANICGGAGYRYLRFEDGLPVLGPLEVSAAEEEVETEPNIGVNWPDLRSFSDRGERRFPAICWY